MTEKFWRQYRSRINGVIIELCCVDAWNTRNNIHYVKRGFVYFYSAAALLPHTCTHYLLSSSLASHLYYTFFHVPTHISPRILKYYTFSCIYVLSYITYRILKYEYTQLLYNNTSVQLTLTIFDLEVKRKNLTF